MNNSSEKKHFLYSLSERIPRLQTVTDFTYSDKDQYEKIETKVGSIESITFYKREDFEKAVIAIVYKCEPREIPASIGAIFVSGLVDHVANEKISLIILSTGPYSGVTEDMVGLDHDEWIEKSGIIRKNHELAHYIQRKLFPENKDAMKDELKADMTGLIKAFGKYDDMMAKIFLGIEDDTYRSGGRLETYYPEGTDMNSVLPEAKNYITYLKERCDSLQGKDAFEILEIIESEQ